MPAGTQGSPAVNTPIANTGKSPSAVPMLLPNPNPRLQLFAAPQLSLVINNHKAWTQQHHPFCCKQSAESSRRRLEPHNLTARSTYPGRKIGFRLKVLPIVLVALEISQISLQGEGSEQEIGFLSQHTLRVQHLLAQVPVVVVPCCAVTAGMRNLGMLEGTPAAVLFAARTHQTPTKPYRSIPTWPACPQHIPEGGRPDNGFLIAPSWLWARE